MSFCISNILGGIMNIENQYRLQKNVVIIGDKNMIRVEKQKIILCSSLNYVIKYLLTIILPHGQTLLTDETDKNISRNCNQNKAKIKIFIYNIQ